MTATSMSIRGGGPNGGGNGGMSLYEGPGPVQQQRTRSKSVAAGEGRFTRDGRAILHFGKSPSFFFWVSFADVEGRC